MISKLKKGDRVDIVATSSFIEEKESFYSGVKIIEDWGLTVNISKFIFRKYGYFSGTDDERFSELMEVQKSKLIFFAKGGWGSARLLEKGPRWGNQWMIGFSDTSSLLLSKYSHGTLGSIHGPMITTLVNEPEWSLERLKNLLFKGFLNDLNGKPLKRGEATGEIIVSNLTIFSFLVGTKHFPNLKGKIVIFEDINEDIYKIDRMITYLRMTQKFEEIAGLGFGNFLNKDANSEDHLFFENLILERFAEFNIPIVVNLPIGHLYGNACIPLGFKTKLNGFTGKLSIDIKLD